VVRGGCLLAVGAVVLGLFEVEVEMVRWSGEGRGSWEGIGSGGMWLRVVGE